MADGDSAESETMAGVEEKSRSSTQSSSSDDTLTAYITLPVRFAELMLVVGIDDNTKLVPLNGQLECSDEENLSNLYDQEYEAHVLAAVSATKALYFEPQLIVDPNYPPSYVSGQPFSGSAMRARASSASGRLQKNIHTPRHLSVNPAMISHHLKGADLPISEDVIRSITFFCFPDHVHVFRDKPDSQVHFLVLTDVSGNKTFACCITFYKPYIIERGTKANLIFTLQPHPENFVMSHKKILGYFPQCCVVVSKHPYFYAMKEILSCMIGHVERDMEEMYTFVKEFTHTMTMTPVPSAGSIIVEMSIYNLLVTLIPAEHPEKPVNDIPLHLVFLCFHADDVLRIFSAILMEQRLVFLSSNYALLTTIMESFLYFILPFRWRFTYVPILSASSLELLDAPGTFMMGCNTKHLDAAEQIEGLVIVNVDEGTIKVNSESSSAQRRSSVVNYLDSTAIPDIPQESASLFKNICKRVKFQLELQDVQRPFYYDIEQERVFRMKKCLQFNKEISFAFLELMVNLFRGVMTILRVDVRQFSKQAFLESIEPVDKPFYEKVLVTDMFRMFIEDRLNERVDYWSDHEFKTRPWAKKAGGIDDPNGRKKNRPLLKQVSISTFSPTMQPPQFDTFRLPTLNDPRKYVKNCIAQLSKEIEKCRNPTVRANYLYLRGVFYAAEHNTMKALEDLLSIKSYYSRLLPVQLCRDLLSLVPEGEREDLLRRKGVGHIQELVTSSEHGPIHRGFVDTVTIPQHDLSLEEFVELVSLLEMASDYDTIQRLFLVLTTATKPGFVEPYNLERLRLAYEENLKLCLQLVVPDGQLKSDECVLRVSALIKTDFGNGRIALTDKRVFFLKDGSNSFKEVVKLTLIEKIEKVRNHSIISSGVEVLVIHSKEGRQKFTAWLKEERNCWAMLVEEMRAGKLVAEATKDFTAISQAIQNVLLVDAIIRSGTDENTAHHADVSGAAERLCYFSAYIAEGRHRLPQDTSQALQHRVDPNSGQRERKTVEVLLYTPGSVHMAEGNTPPRLWCGLGDGKVKVFDATNWILEKTFVQTKGNVACMAAVGEAQVWAGAQGIFIIDTATISCTKMLTEHRELVSDMVITNNGRHAFTASVDGSIIKWEVQTLAIIFRFQLEKHSIRSLCIHDDRLWCGTWEQILVVDQSGNHLQSFQYQSVAPSASVCHLDCFLLVGSEVWAGCRRQGIIVVWEMLSAKLVSSMTLDCRGVSVMRHIDGKVWVGTKDGTIFIYEAANRKLWKSIKAHDDAVRALCAAESRYVMSGAGSKDGKVAIWSPSQHLHDETDRGFED